MLAFFSASHVRFLALPALLVAILAYKYLHNGFSLSAQPKSFHHSSGMREPEWTFNARRGFFSHDDDPESWEFRATTRANLGIKENTYTTDWEFDPKKEKGQWERLVHYVQQLNKVEPDYRRYKIFYIIRHGQGIHNVKEGEFGREEWDRHWSKLSGDGTVVWEDAALTPHGEQQARDIATFFNTSEAPLPDSVFSSPLNRCLQTTELAFENVLRDSDRKPIIKEKLRERLGLHTCDKRSTKSSIAAAHPLFEIEPGFTEEDELWRSDVRESYEEHIERAAELLGDIFENSGDDTIVSLTAHSGTLMAIFGATEWKRIPVAAGAIYPLLIVAEASNQEAQRVKILLNKT